MSNETKSNGDGKRQKLINEYFSSNFKMDVDDVTKDEYKLEECNLTKSNDEINQEEKAKDNKEDTLTEYDLIKSNGFSFNYECDSTKLSDLEPSLNHTILFDHISFKCNDHFGPPSPLPIENFVDEWNDNYVKMPFSNYNLDGKDQNQWREISRSLNMLSSTLDHDPDSIHIEYAIKKYNSKYNSKYWNFDVLHYFFNEEIEKNKSEIILKELFPKIIKLALALPNKIRKAIPILKQEKPHSITLSQEQCACILANAFFCTFPDRIGKENTEKLPFINFNSLFSKSRHEKRISSRKVEKLKFIFNYFDRITKKIPCGLITFSRKSITELDIPNFKESKKNLRKPIIALDGTIEDCTGALQLDFANKYLGGGVLNSGCVQEEIRFLICPELFVSMLFTECLNENESFLIKGFERFSSYKGYGDTCKFASNYVDETACDEWSRRFTHLLAIDALFFKYSKAQFNEANIRRELIKSYCGFKIDSNHTFTNSLEAEDKASFTSVIATGNWGCGAFNGDRQLKFLIQLMAAAEANRDLIYFTFNDKSTVKNLKILFETIQRENLTVGNVYELVNEYGIEIRTREKIEIKNFGLVEFFQTKYSSVQM